MTRCQGIFPSSGMLGCFPTRQCLLTAGLPGHLLVRPGHRQGAGLLLSQQSHSCLVRVSMSPGVHVSVCRISSQRSLRTPLCSRPLPTLHPAALGTDVGDARGFLRRTDVCVSTLFFTVDFQKWNDETQRLGMLAVTLLSRRRPRLHLLPVPSQDRVTGYRVRLEAWPWGSVYQIPGSGAHGGPHLRLRVKGKEGCGGRAQRGGGATPSVSPDTRGWVWPGPVCRRVQPRRWGLPRSVPVFPWDASS